jgi:hypothetical protein
MFKKPATPKQQNEPTTPEPRREPKFGRPKILAIDISDDAVQAIADEGYNVSMGTFGKPYRVKTWVWLSAGFDDSVPPELRGAGSDYRRSCSG